jgi:hypothetical protein
LLHFIPESITTSGGPESFTGLPGMILGLAIPHEHITWFATKVYTETIPETAIKAPVKGKKITNCKSPFNFTRQAKRLGQMGKKIYRADNDLIYCVLSFCTFYLASLRRTLVLLVLLSTVKWRRLSRTHKCATQGTMIVAMQPGSK